MAFLFLVFSEIVGGWKDFTTSFPLYLKFADVAKWVQLGSSRAMNDSQMSFYSSKMD